MRFAVISDIHGNCLALQEVLKDIEINEIDEIVCLGDVITLGLQPLEVLQQIKKMDCIFIIGNHESALLDMQKASDFKIAPPVIPVLEWCKSKLTFDDLDFLKSFKESYTINLEDKDQLLCFHGSPSSNIDIITSDTSYKKIDHYFSKFKNNFFIGGHSHLQMLRQHNGKLIINPGSVGMPFLNIPAPGESPKILPWAEYAIIDYNKGRLSVDLKRVEFNIHALEMVLKNSDIPLKEWWKEQYSY